MGARRLLARPLSSYVHHHPVGSGKGGDIDDDDNDHDDDPFSLLSSLAATALLQSDRRRDAVGKDEEWGQGSSATNWIDEGSAFAFRKALDKVRLYLPGGKDDEDDGYRRGREGRDEAITWLRWMRSVPSPLIVDLSSEARLAADGTVSDDFLRLLDGDLSCGRDEGVIAVATMGDERRMRRTRSEFMDGIQCRLILLPSGLGLGGGGLFEPAGSLTFSKLLYGGVTRYRILPSSSGGGGSGGDVSSSDASSAARKKPPRRVGERTERKTSASDHVPSWVQYGGAERRYDAVDMGPAMVLEFTLLPKIQGGVVDNLDNDSGDNSQGRSGGDMTLRRLAWRPTNMFRYVVVDDDKKPNNGSAEDEGGATTSSSSSLLQGKDRNNAFVSDFRSRVGGLSRQIDNIVRRVLDGRVIRPAEVDVDGNLLSYGEAKGKSAGGSNDDAAAFLSSLDDASRRLSMVAMEAEELALLGLTPVRGLLLYGPPGCGKTALAREIARALRARAPKIVSAPELLDRWVGGSERLVRELFHDAEAELASVNGDASRSALHVIVIDEIDAVFRKRSSAEDSGEATRSSTVNQILSKLDGVKSIPNVLLIGMTNRRELLDEALLRPGRLEVQIEIPLPDREGRREILNIHFGALRNRGRLSHPLCCAIDGRHDRSEDDGVVPVRRERGRKRRALKKATEDVLDYFYPSRNAAFDLAHDSVTGGFSGADLEGLVRCAGSIALSRAREEGAGIESLLITLDDVKQALREVKI
jgi:vesicle-fusing ATPase